MNNEERDMIAGLFDRLRQTGLAEKDRDAEKLIGQYFRQMPDAPYMLVQTVLIQEHALGQAEERIRDLEQQLAATQPRAASSGSGSFLGGIRGGARGAPASGGSVPSTGGRRMAEPEPGYSSPWGAPAQPQQMPPQQMQPQQVPQQSSGGGLGGFMRGALTTAAGVAGGMMIGDALRGMMGGSSNPLGGGHGHSSTSGSPLGGPGDKPHYQEASNNDPGGGYLASDHAQDVAQDDEEELNSDDWTVDDSTEA